MIQSAINKTLSLAGVLTALKPKAKALPVAPDTQEPVKEEGTVPSSDKAEVMAGKANASLIAERKRFLKSKEILRSLTEEED